ncbi:hypothetical protein Tco_0436346 [Tanacetum coccineum]
MGPSVSLLDTHIRISIHFRLLIDAVTAALPSPSLPPLPPSLYIPPPVDHRDDIPESEQPPCKRLYLSIIGSRYEIEEVLMSQDYLEDSTCLVCTQPSRYWTHRASTFTYGDRTDSQETVWMWAGGGGPMSSERLWLLDGLSHDDSSRRASEPSVIHVFALENYLLMRKQDEVPSALRDSDHRRQDHCRDSLEISEIWARDERHAKEFVTHTAKRSRARAS